ncbi:Chemotaxis protein methyltransferase Cher2 [wastewater metagenome]|uniref:protein-glutamate O-methyltransferase n=2 Tax=unclassified sequences TaxID=12908 RepID=A0A5B8RGD6_9ZZZZ|nr:protein-glutamate O-methyltransferase CheR [Arhodomonas aquaeolei]QEA07940.1 chemotaxis protein methyltransferase Cher2 [uncultured organism]
MALESRKDNNTMAAADYEAFRRFLEERSGIMLGENKQYLVTSRLAPLLRRHSLADLGALVQRLQSAGGQQLRTEVVDAMTTNETQWFRDIYPFRILADQLFPEFERRGKRHIRIWSAACSSGQEAYSVSMTLSEYQAKGRNLDATIVGTDISTQIVGRAKAAEYSASEIRRGLSEERQRRYFDAVDQNTWRVRPEVTRRVSFRQHNLLEAYGTLGRFDLILCRNTLIYFSMPTRTDLIRRMGQALEPGGYLMVGASESLPRELTEFEMVRCHPGVVYRRKD